MSDGDGQTMSWGWYASFGAGFAILFGTMLFADARYWPEAFSRVIPMRNGYTLGFVILMGTLVVWAGMEAFKYASPYLATLDGKYSISKADGIIRDDKLAAVRVGGFMTRFWNMPGKEATVVFLDESLIPLGWGLFVRAGEREVDLDDLPSTLQEKLLRRGWPTNKIVSACEPRFVDVRAREVWETAKQYQHANATSTQYLKDLKSMKQSSDLTRITLLKNVKTLGKVRGGGFFGRLFGGWGKDEDDDDAWKAQYVNQRN